MTDREQSRDYGPEEFEELQLLRTQTKQYREALEQIIVEYKDHALLTRAEQIAREALGAPAPQHEPHCEITGNPCGTDTRRRGTYCGCETCKRSHTWRELTPEAGEETGRRIFNLLKLVGQKQTELEAAQETIRQLTERELNLRSGTGMMPCPACSTNKA